MRMLITCILAAALMPLFPHVSSGEPVDQLVNRDDDYYAHIANAEDDELKFNRSRETEGFICGAYKAVSYTHIRAH